MYGCRRLDDDEIVEESDLTVGVDRVGKEVTFYVCEKLNGLTASEALRLYGKEVLRRVSVT